jgi:hypothetical protein
LFLAAGPLDIQLQNFLAGVFEPRKSFHHRFVLPGLLSVCHPNAGAFCEQAETPIAG